MNISDRIQNLRKTKGIEQEENPLILYLGGWMVYLVICGCADAVLMKKIKEK